VLVGEVEGRGLGDEGLGQVRQVVKEELSVVAYEVEVLVIIAEPYLY